MPITILLPDYEPGLLSDIVSIEEWNWAVTLSEFDN